MDQQKPLSGGQRESRSSSQSNTRLITTSGQPSKYKNHSYNSITHDDDCGVMANKGGGGGGGGVVLTSVTEVASADETSSAASLIIDEVGHKTTGWQTFVHLSKGNIGPGMLSLPWAFSVLGSIPLAICAVLVMSLWSSHNCWKLIQIKRYIEQEQLQQQQQNSVTCNNDEDDNSDDDDDEGSASLLLSTRTVAMSNVTYPDIGSWAYGKSFQSYVSACICVQQMSITTVFLSFIGENLLAVLSKVAMTAGGDSNSAWWVTHSGVMTMVLPCCLLISFIPSLKGLAPVISLAGFFLIVTLGFLFVVGVQVWPDRPDIGSTQDDPLLLAQSPFLALCAILYSFEGICIVLPTESAMQNPKRDFGPAFVSAMIVVAAVLAGFSAACVMAFGPVTNGSVTAYLMFKHAHDDNVNENLTWLLLGANAAISFSVLLTYPLQLFPAVELLAPSWSKFFSKRRGIHSKEVGTVPPLLEAEEDYDEKDLTTGYDFLPPLAEHANEEYGDEENETALSNNINIDDANSPPWTRQGSFTLDRLRRRNSSIGGLTEDGLSVRSFMSSAAFSLPNMLTPKMVLPGDSLPFRASLVLLTYGIAVAVPNVEALISLAGAVAGSSTALLIPTLLELAWCRHLEKSSSKAGSIISPTLVASPVLSKSQNQKQRTLFPPSKFLLTQIKCCILFTLGLCFMLLGTWASLQDIVAVYSGHG